MAEPIPYGIRAIWITPWINPGWNRRRRDNRRLESIQGWRLALHRILWGFHRLVYVEHQRLDLSNRKLVAYG